MLKRVIISALVSLAGCVSLTTQTATAPTPPVRTEPRNGAERALEFMLARPEEASIGRKLSLWATWYHMPVVEPALLAAAAKPLVGVDGNAISDPLRRDDWCYAALQGSVWVKNAGAAPTAYVYIDAKGPEQHNCDAALGDLPETVKRATRRARFAIFRHHAGCDVRRYPLQPFRTIAVDPKRIPTGTVLFVPQLRGELFRLGGETYAHDGYLIANDRGGAIRGNHIDVFVEKRDGDPDPLAAVIGSHPNRTFLAYAVKKSDPSVEALTAGQEKVCAQPPTPPSAVI